MLASEMSQSKPMARNGLEGGSGHGHGVWPPIQWQIVFCLPIAFLFLARRRNAEPRTVSLLLPAPPFCAAAGDGLGGFGGREAAVAVGIALTAVTIAVAAVGAVAARD